MHRQIKHYLIGNLENRRVRMFQEALQRIGLSPAVEISYASLLKDVSVLDQIPKNSVVRIESPGENHHTEIGLIELGAGLTDNSNCEHIDAEGARSLPFDRGRIRFFRQWYLGFEKLLHRILERLDGKVRWYNHPTEISLLFDKRTCQHRLANLSLPVPEILTDIQNYDDLVTAAKSKNWNRLFVKPAHSSSASGVIALRFDGDRVRAVTPMELETDKGLVKRYNSLRIATYTDLHQVRGMVEFVLNENGIVEKWLPKATFNAKEFDLRVLVINGHAEHAVARSSHHPMTNLHLGSKRIEIEDVIQKIGSDQWQLICESAEKCVLACAPKSLYVGVDLLLSPQRFSPTVLELNAFGDLLPGVVYHHKSSYESEIRHFLQTQIPDAF